MTAVILLVLKASIILSAFAIGLKATFADATFLLRRPGHLIRALLSMNVLMSLTALAVGAPFDLHPAVKIARGRHCLSTRLRRLPQSSAAFLADAVVARTVRDSLMGPQEA